MKLKRCFRCKGRKFTNQFSKGHSKDGRYAICKECFKNDFQRRCEEILGEGKDLVVLITGSSPRGFTYGEALQGLRDLEFFFRREKETLYWLNRPHEAKLCHDLRFKAAAGLLVCEKIFERLGLDNVHRQCEESSR